MRCAARVGNAPCRPCMRGDPWGIGATRLRPGCRESPKWLYLNRLLQQEYQKVSRPQNAPSMSSTCTAARKPMLRFRMVAAPEAASVIRPNAATMSAGV